MSQAIYAVSLKHIANDNAPMTQSDHIAFLWDAVLSSRSEVIV